MTAAFRYSLALGSLAFTAPTWAADVQLRLQIPQIEGSRVLRPYVAVWLEKTADHSFAGNLAVWYDQTKRNNAGTKWVKDLREWWRVAGSQTTLPLDGVSGATRAPGEHVLSLGNSEALAKLAPGAYEVVVEAAREHGGREVLRLPLQWAPRSAQQAQALGKEELGTVTLSVKP
jgi:hypothetical protein